MHEITVVGAVEALFLVVGVAERDAGAEEQDQAVVLPFRPEDRVVVGVGDDPADLPCAGGQEAVEIGPEGDGVGLFARGGVEHRGDADALGRLVEAHPLFLGVRRHAGRQEQCKQTEDMGGFQHVTKLGKSLIFSYESAIFVS